MTSTTLLERPVELWRPKDIKNTEMEKFRLAVNKKFNINLELWKWSTENISEFWAMVWDFTNIIYSIPYKQVLEESKPMDQNPSWFIGAKLNFAENLLRCRDKNKIALISTGEGRIPIRITYEELYNRVNHLASAMRLAGVKVGDRVCAYISNCIEAVIAMLAASSIGAIWSSTSTDFGVTAVLDRFLQIKPKILLSVNAVIYNNKTHDHLSKLRKVVESLVEEKQGGGCLEKVIIIPFVTDSSSTTSDDSDISSIPLAISWNDFLNTCEDPLLKKKDLIFEQLPFDHPLYILFSSGTTGKPKCLVHRSGGMLIQHKKEHILHGNLNSNDVFFYYTTTGWMMWNWLVSGLFVGCTLVLYDGSPFQPKPSILWELVDELGITIFGTSAKYIQSLQDINYKPKDNHKLNSLRIIFSTGSPLKPESFDFIYKEVKDDILLGSITGGTDICSLFAGHNVTLPVYKGEIQCVCLGMKIEAWEAQGKPVYGKSADLVCVKPFPCMPIYFWNDDSNNSKYKSTYFSRYSSVWYHGDFVIINNPDVNIYNDNNHDYNNNGVIMLGRSDSTLNPGGVRFGSAEIYNVIESNFNDLVKDSLVVGQKLIVEDDERVVLFLVMNDDVELNDGLISKIKKCIRDQLSPRHVPSVILPIQDIPVEVAVKRIISGENVIVSGTLANPDSLSLYYDLPELKLTK
ncbi:17927_t:CDS:2 [Entrophospora sp. SA101]|nr:17927_t:CDS:2 [Entrophospora sp. SA101]